MCTGSGALHEGLGHIPRSGPYCGISFGFGGGGVDYNSYTRINPKHFFHSFTAGMYLCSLKRWTRYGGSRHLCIDLTSGLLPLHHTLGIHVPK